jgi:hypothetical protein
MAGGSLSLASSRGTGEDIININPEITFFKKVYKRHTNFGIETKEISSNNSNIDFGSNITYNIDSYGSLLSNMHLEFTLPSLFIDTGDNHYRKQIQADAGNRNVTIDNNDTGKTGFRIKIVSGTGFGQVRELGKPKGTDGKYRIKTQWNTPPKTDSLYVLESADSQKCRYLYYVNSVGHAVLDTVELNIKNTTIDKHNSLWLDIWNELTDTNRKEWSLIGKHDADKSTLESSTFKQGVTSFSDKLRLYVPLKFYFNRNPGLAFPIFLLDDNSVKIKIKLNSKLSIVKFLVENGTDNINLDYLNISNFKFYTTYVFLDQDEENRIKRNLPSEYLIETLIINESMTTQNLSKIDNISNPMKEMIWVFRNNKRLTTYSGNGNYPNAISNTQISNSNEDEFSNDIFNYSFHRINENLGYGSRDPISKVKILISNNTRVDETDSSFFRTIQPYNHHSNVPGGINSIEKKKYIYVYSFSLNPEEYQPSGTFNFSKLDDYLTIELTSVRNDGQTRSSGVPENYRMDLFFVVYKYLSVGENSISLQDVPFAQAGSTGNNLGTRTAGKASKEPETEEEKEQKVERQVADAKVEEAKQIEREIRYIKKPHVHGHHTKRRWGGLQDEYLK